MKEKQTYILRWNPEISSWGKKDYERDYGKGFYDLAFRLPVGMNWSIYEWENLYEGDEFYFFITGDDQTAALVGKGHFISKPYKAANWKRGNGRRVIHYADFLMESSIHPDNPEILHVADFRDQIPDYDFGHGHAGVLLDPDTAEKLDLVFETFRQKQLTKIQTMPSYQARTLAPCIQIEDWGAKYYPDLEGEKFVEGYSVCRNKDDADWDEFWVEETTFQADLAVDWRHVWESFWNLSERFLPEGKVYFEIHVEDYDPIHSITPASLTEVKKLLSEYRQIFEEDGKVSLLLFSEKKDHYLMLHATKDILLSAPNTAEIERVLTESGFLENENAILFSAGNHLYKTFSLHGKKEFPSELYFEMTEKLHTTYGELLYDDDEYDEEEDTEE